MAWKGQFSPELVEAILQQRYSTCHRLIDPFAGSGTVLAEAARLNKAATGAELNPAAYLLSRLYELCSKGDEYRRDLVRAIQDKIKSFLSPTTLLFDGREENSIDADQLLAIAHEMTINERVVFDAFFLLLDPGYKQRSRAEAWLQWLRFSGMVLGLPICTAPISAIRADARSLPVANHYFDGLITSPPYINVFNYHQQYRRSVEMLGYSPLAIAKGEIGSNRKNRSNRYNTVIQYILEMADILAESNRVMKQGSTMTFVVGRESNVMKTPFYNSEILASIARVVGLKIIERQERWFTNRYGLRIYEDLLHFRVDAPITVDAAPLRALAKEVLVNAIDRAPDAKREFLVGAIRESEAVGKSSIVEV